MVLVQIYLNSTNQYVDLNLPAGRYKVRWSGCQYNYSAGDAQRFPIQFRSTFTMQKYGNIRYTQVQLPNAHHGQIQGELKWEADYNGAFQMEVIDTTTGTYPVANRFTDATLFYDVESIDPNINKFIN
jgi:hypothetical protein